MDTVSGTTALTTVIPFNINQTTEAFPALARYVVSPGSHVITACVTSASDPADNVHIYGFGFPPASPNNVPSAPPPRLSRRRYPSST